MIQPNFLLLIFLVLLLSRSALQLFLNRLNIAHLRTQGIAVPDSFKDVADPERLKRISAYTIDSANLEMIATLVHQAIFLAILLSGLLPRMAMTIESWGKGPIFSGLAFFALLLLFLSLPRLPFTLYDVFVIEERYGFNTSTFRIWVLDLLKSLLLSTILGGFVLWLLLALILYGGRGWWVMAWMGVGLFELLMLWLFPVAIAPLFNKFEPIENKALEDRIRILMAKAGLGIKGVFKMDASKRSKHTNAYFTGIGKNKQIVLFDTLLESHTEEEILAVLAHEVGHWKKRHVLKQLLLAEVLSLIVFYLVARCLNWPLLYRTFGFEGPVAYAGLFLTGAFLDPLGYFAQPFESAISRKFEREADDFVLALMKTAGPMVSALKRLAADNLANLTPHPLYAWFYYSHPPLVERISRLSEAERVEQPQGPP